MTELLVLNAGKHELQAVSLDGTRVRTLVAGLDELPDGIVVDQRRGHVYWTNMGTPDPGSEHTGDAAFSRNGLLERRRHRTGEPRLRPYWYRACRTVSSRHV